MANEVCFLVTILRPVLYSTICKLKNLNFVYYDSEAEFNYTLARARQYFAQDAYEDLRRKYKSAHRFKEERLQFKVSCPSKKRFEIMYALL